MLKYFLFSIILFFALGSIAAQSSINYNTKIQSNFSTSYTFSSDTLKILAVMADFQIDKDEATFGDGSFGSIYSKDYGNSIIDPLPHDKSYFENHLTFAKNYFSQVSNNILIIKYTVLPNVVTVSKAMRNYSPPRNSDDFTNLANYSKEVWELASTANSGINFSDYNLFIVFHAGVGNEVTLPGSLGIEKDLPSIFLSNKSLKKIYGQLFDGFTLNNSTFKIPNTMIMPETESRESENILGTTLVELTFNGLLAANIGSFIGLPDLFNTSTGESAIGRFGLMDGESFFSFRGLFPPQPSAWEKIKLGWTQPVSISPGNYNINLITDIASTISDTVILKVPISSKEYFLIENRNRDARKDGAIIQYISGSDTLQKTFLKDDLGFNNFDTDSLEGVLINVEEYDWALPGNGILIWHIDENIIDAKIDDNKINADSKNRGIFLEEADGIFDIGEQFITVIGDVVIGQGGQDDFWFSGNPSEFYLNRFAPDTRPSSNSNNGANSLITISNFSTISNSMSFNVSYGDSLITPLVYKKLNLSSNKNHITVLENVNNVSFSVVSDTSMYLLNSNGDIINTFNGFSIFKTAFVNTNNINYLFGVNSNKLNIYMSDGLNSFNGSLTINDYISTTPVIRKNLNDLYELLIGTANGKVYIYSLGNLPSTLPSLKDSLSTTSGSIKFLAASRDYYSFISEPMTLGPTPNNNFGDSQGNLSPLLGYNANNLVLTENKNGDYTSIVSTSSKIFVFDNGVLNNTIEFSDNSSNQFTNIISLTDLKNDGNNYLTYTLGNKIIAQNINGFNAKNFPFNDLKEIGFSSNTISADFVGDGKAELISITNDGRIIAVNGNNSQIVDGFPIMMGNYNSPNLSYFELNNKGSLAVIDSANYFYVWSIASTSGNPIWSEENGNAFNNNFLSAAKSVNIINSFLPKDRTYNYPNPVYGTTTNIRYFVNEDSKINIKIFDIAGELVAELNNTAKGEFDNETIWNVSRIQSGVYLARIEAVGYSGKTETNIIKIAVVK
ncbi:MAG: hypothetical protein CO128_06895 [Ignavibacteriales bacterium CG_4_9_14_3_um_filter_30_11]|nr:MAG: hypothetical protein CO128_06895 [Ignavibacteriales bacterium CG_4_9_14_3_um_filter_30_11]